MGLAFGAGSFLSQRALGTHPTLSRRDDGPNHRVTPSDLADVNTRFKAVNASSHRETLGYAQMALASLAPTHQERTVSLSDTLSTRRGQPRRSWRDLRFPRSGGWHWAYLPRESNPREAVSGRTSVRRGVTRRRWATRGALAFKSVGLAGDADLCGTSYSHGKGRESTRSGARASRGVEIRALLRLASSAIVDSYSSRPSSSGQAATAASGSRYAAHNRVRAAQLPLPFGTRLDTDTNSPLHRLTRPLADRCCRAQESGSA